MSTQNPLSDEAFMALIERAYSMNYQELARFVLAARGLELPVLVECFETRIRLHWARLANWHIRTNGTSEHTGILLATREVGNGFDERMDNALQGKFDGHTFEESREIANRAGKIVDDAQQQGGLFS